VYTQVIQLGSKSKLSSFEIREQKCASEIDCSTAGWRVFNNVVPLITLCSLSALIFWGVSGILAFELDDYLQTKLYSSGSFPVDIPGYVRFLGNDRGVLHWSYFSLWKLASNNLDLPFCGFVGLYVLSAYALYFVLRRSLSPTPSLIGALLYLSQFAKFRAVIIYNAQIYIAVTSCAILFLYVLTSRLSRRIQAAIVLPLYWLSLHFYEILIVCVPIMTLAWTVPNICKTKKFSWRDFGFGVAPWLITGFHVAVLSLGKALLWQRNPADSTNIQTLFPNLCGLFGLSLSQLIGPLHLHVGFQSIPLFFEFDLRHNHHLAVPLVASVLSLLAVSIGVWKYGKCAEKPSLKQKAIAVCGLYLALFSSLIIIAEYAHEVPGRILMLPCFGLALAVAALLEMVRKDLHFKIAATVALVWCAAESIAFADIVQQHESAMATENRITSQICSLKPFKVQQGQQLFISYPFQDRKRYWHESEPRYFQYAPIGLWAAYDLGFDKIGFANKMRSATSLEPLGMNLWLSRQLGSKTGSMLVPFYLDDKDQLKAITVISLLDGNGRTVRTIHTALDGQVQPEYSMSLNIAAKDFDMSKDRR